MSKLMHILRKTSWNLMSLRFHKAGQQSISIAFPSNSTSKIFYPLIFESFLLWSICINIPNLWGVHKQESSSAWVSILLDCCRYNVAFLLRFLQQFFEEIYFNRTFYESCFFVETFTLFVLPIFDQITQWLQRYKRYKLIFNESKTESLKWFCRQIGLLWGITV